MEEKISAFVITKNEEEKIENCLNHLLWADEIIILDSKSTDNTVKKARKYTKKVFSREFDGYGTQKQAAIDKCTNNWILEVDADEIITKELQEEIIKLKQSQEINKYAGYTIQRQEYFLNKKLMVSKIPRLYKKENVKYKGYIHENLDIKGSIGHLKNKIEHESDKYESIAKRVEKINEYTKKEAEYKIREQQWTTAKVLLNMIIIPECYFLWFYLRKALILKGYRGLIWSLLTAYYHFLIYAKLYEYIYKAKEASNSRKYNEKNQN